MFRRLYWLGICSAVIASTALVTALVTHSEAASPKTSSFQRAGGKSQVDVACCGLGTELPATFGSVDPREVKKEKAIKTALTMLLQQKNKTKTLRSGSYEIARDNLGRRLILNVNDNNVQSWVVDNGKVRTAAAGNGFTGFFCKARCFDSMCAACMKAICAWLECVESSSHSACREERQKVLLYCGGTAGALKNPNSQVFTQQLAK